MLINRHIPGLYDGVSQQSPTLRSPLQSEEEINTWGTLADGLGKRPPTEHLALIVNGPVEDAAFEHINRDADNQFLVVVANGDLKVFDYATGAERSVSFPAGKAYLASANPAADFAFTTVTDYTFVVNRTVTPAMLDASAPPDPDYLRWLNRDDAGGIRNYPDYYPSPGFYAGEVQRFEDLPETAADGAVYKIAGTNENLFVSYYVQRRGAVWEEARDPAEQINRIDPATMPHALVRQGQSFVFAPFAWAQRRVGDADTNPQPAFIGRPIMDVTYVQSRLCLLVDEEVVLSATGDFGNFWRNTMTTYVASDPCTAGANTANVVYLQWAVPFGDSVMLFGKDVQLKLTWGEAGLTPDSISMTPVTAYVTNPRVKPVASGRDVYFCANSAAFTRVYEYFNRQEDEGSNTVAEDVTAHVPRYIPSDALGITADVTNDCVAVLSRDSRVFVYKYHWMSAQERGQSAWRCWTFWGRLVRSIKFIGSSLYLVVQRDNQTFLERLDLQSGAKPALADHQIYLDRRVVTQGVYREVTDDTVFTVPWRIPDLASPGFRIVRSNLAPAGKGESLIDPSTYVFLSDTQVAVPGDFSGGPCFAGMYYLMRYRFSPQFPEGRDGKVIAGYTVTRTITLYYTNAAYFRTRVDPYGVGIEVQVEEVIPGNLSEFTGKTVGAARLILGTPQYDSGVYSFGVYGRSGDAVVDIDNDSHVGAFFQAADVEMTHHRRQ